MINNPILTGEGEANRTAAQTNAIDNVIQQILAGTTDTDIDVESRKRDLNKVAIFTSVTLDQFNIHALIYFAYHKCVV